jgi:GNAT superfamily N-acetyltransferase
VERVEVVVLGVEALGDYARVPIAFEVARVLELDERAGGLGGFALHERTLETPWIKDYDACPGDHPTAWGQRFDLSRWEVFGARRSGRLVGGATVAWSTPGVWMLEGRTDLAVLWDLRVAPDARGHGVGTALFEAVERWATARGCRELAVETQNVNVPACEFYAARGCRLGTIRRLAYPEAPDEVQLLWTKPLPPA